MRRVCVRVRRSGAGAIAAAALCWLLGTHVWAIQTEIAPAIDETAVMQQLSEMGVRIGMPIKKLWNPNEQIVLPDEYVPGKHHPSSPAIEAGDDPAAMNHPVKTSGTSIGALGAIPLSQPAMISEKAGIGTSARWV